MDRRLGSDSEEAPEIASELLELSEKPPEPLAPSPQALGVWELAWPTIISMLTMTMVRWADIMMVGDLGAEAVAAVSGGGHFYWFLQNFVAGVTTGLVALVARAVGARDWRLADATLRQSIVLGTLVATVVMLAGFPLAGVAMRIYGLNERVVEYGATYLYWLLAGNVPFILTFVFSAALRAAGDTRTPLYAGVAANLLNLFLNWVLIYGHLGSPAFGVAGASMASSLAMLFQVAWFWPLWATHRLRLVPSGASWKPDFDLWRRIVRIGYPATIEGGLFSLGIFGFMRLMSEYGTAEFVAYNLGAQILTLSFLPGIGFATAASTLVGQHLGKGDSAEAARSGWRSLGGSIVSMSALGAAMIALASPIARAFIDDDEIVALTVDFVWILGVAQPLMAVEFALGGALRGAGDTRFPLVAVFLGLFLCRLLPASILALWFHAPIQLVWSVLLLDYGLKAVLLAARFRGGRWKLVRI